MGARVIHPPTDIPKIGRFSLVSDPSGAVFGVIRYAEMPVETTG